MTHETTTVASEICIWLVTFGHLSMGGTNRRESVNVFASSHCHKKDQPNSSGDTASGVDWSDVGERRVTGGRAGKDLRPPMWKMRAEILRIVKGADCGQAVKILNKVLITYSCRIRMETKMLEMTA